jgi:hypothetical protein
MPELNSLDLARLRTGADDLQRLAAVYGVSLPDEHRHALQVTAEARRIAALAPPPIPMPANPEKTSDAIRKAATARMLARESAAVATEVADKAERRAWQLAYQAIPDVFAALSAAFGDARDDFAHLVDEGAPLEMTADVSAERAVEHVQLLGAVNRLTAAAASRLQLAGIVGEEIKGQTIVWLVLSPKPETTLDEIRSVLGTGELPHDLAGWLRMVHLGASLAHDGEASARSQRFEAATHHAGYGTPDGGMLASRTYAEALALVPTPGVGQ